jgi:hypothetical protein
MKRKNEEHETTKLRRLSSAATTKLEPTLVSVPRDEAEQNDIAPGNAQARLSRSLKSPLRVWAR